MRSNVSTKKMTPEEYFSFEEQSELRHEYINGELFEMAGTTKEHNKMISKFAFLLMQLLMEGAYDIFHENVKVAIENEKDYTYPDICVALPDSHVYLAQSPILIAEVLSDSTRIYDTTDKFIRYRKISSLQYYLLVEPEKMFVTLYFKMEDGNWDLMHFDHENDLIELPSLEIQLPLKKLYPA